MSDDKPPLIFSAKGFAKWEAEHPLVQHPTIESPARGASIWDSIEPLREILPLGRRNGVGTILLGWHKHPELGASHIKMVWFTFFFIPVLPLLAYVVCPQGGGVYQF